MEIGPEDFVVALWSARWNPGQDIEGELLVTLKRCGDGSYEVRQRFRYFDDGKKSGITIMGQFPSDDEAEKSMATHLENEKAKNHIADLVHVTVRGGRDRFLEALMAEPRLAFTMEHLGRG